MARYQLQEVVCLPDYRKYADVLYSCLQYGVDYTLDEVDNALIIHLKDCSPEYKSRINSGTHTKLGKYAIA